MVFAKKAIQPAPIYFRSLQLDLIQCLRCSKDYNQTAVLCKQSIQVDIQHEKFELDTYTQTGNRRMPPSQLGVVHAKQEAAGLSSKEERNTHINELSWELLCSEWSYLPNLSHTCWYKRTAWLLSICEQDRRHSLENSLRAIPRITQTLCNTDLPHSGTSQERRTLQRTKIEAIGNYPQQYSTIS